MLLYSARCALPRGRRSIWRAVARIRPPVIRSRGGGGRQHTTQTHAMSVGCFASRSQNSVPCGALGGFRTSRPSPTAGDVDEGTSLSVHVCFHVRKGGFELIVRSLGQSSMETGNDGSSLHRSVLLICETSLVQSRVRCYADDMNVCRPAARTHWGRVVGRRMHSPQRSRRRSA